MPPFAPKNLCVGCNRLDTFVDILNEEQISKRICSDRSDLGQRKEAAAVSRRKKIKIEKEENTMKKRNRMFAMLLCLVLALTLAVGCAKNEPLPPGEILTGVEAYQKAVSEGYTGSVEEWLESLTDESLVDAEHGWDAMSAFREAKRNGYEKLLNDWIVGFSGLPRTADDTKVKIRGVHIYFSNLDIEYTNNDTVFIGEITGISGDWYDENNVCVLHSPRYNMNEEEFVICSVENSSGNTSCFDAENDGYLLNDAVYDRNQRVIDRMYCKISVTTTGPFGDPDALVHYLSGSATCNLISGASFYMVRWMNRGLFSDLASLDEVGLDYDFFQNSYNDALRITNRQYLVAERFTYSWYRYQSAVFFNRNMFVEKGIDYPYQLVREGADHVGGWTAEKMMELSANFYRENGNGSFDAEDTFGLMMFVGRNSSQADCFRSAFGLRILELDEDGYLKKIDSIDKDTWGASLTKFLGLLNEEYGCGLFSDMDVLDAFTNNQAAMMVRRLDAVENQQMIQFDKHGEGYGILPLPKANDEQLEYYGYASYHMPLLAIPSALEDTRLKNSSIFLQVFAEESYIYSMPMYYEKMLVPHLTKDLGFRAFDDVFVDSVDLYMDDLSIVAQFRYVFDGTKTVAEVLDEHILTESFPTVLRERNGLYREMDARLKQTQ